MGFALNARRGSEWSLPSWPLSVKLRQLSATVPTIEPTEFRAGTVVEWTRAVTDYSYADGWRLTYRLRGVGELDISTTADDDGNGFAVEITAAQTSALPAGDYWMVGTVTRGDDTREAFSGAVKILPNFATLTAGYDGRSHAKKMLDALQSSQLTGAGNRIVEYTIFGERTVKTLTPVE